MASGYALPPASDPRHDGSSSTSRIANNAQYNASGLGIEDWQDDAAVRLTNNTAFISNRDQSPQSHQDVHSSHSHTHEHTHVRYKSNGLMNGLANLGRPKGRARGESDLGRPANTKSTTFRPTLSDLPDKIQPTHLSRELVTAVLLCLAFVTPLTRFSASCQVIRITREHRREILGGPTDHLRHLKDGISSLTESTSPGSQFSCGIAEALLLASALSLITGVLSQFRRNHVRSLQPGYASPRMPTNKKPEVSKSTGFKFSMIRSAIVQCLSIFLPFFASIKLGNCRCSLILLCAYATGLQKVDQLSGVTGTTMWAAIALAFVTDVLGITASGSMTDTVQGYAAIVAALTLTKSPLSDHTGVGTHFSSGQSTPISPFVTPRRQDQASSKLSTTTPTRAGAELMTPLILTSLTLLIIIVTGYEAVAFFDFVVSSIVPLGAAVLATIYAKPHTLRSPNKIGVISGIVCLLLLGTFHVRHTWREMIEDVFISGVFLIAVMMDSRSHATSQGIRKRHHHNTEHYSAITAFLLDKCEGNSLVHDILSEKDSRRIAYFTCLNFAFMLVQGLYGYLSGSLGLLSDTVHMFFDCLGLVVGLGAAIASRWPPSKDRPFGWGKLNTLAGFGNGVFLMLVSVEFVWEAIEGILEGRELRRVQELLVVSTLGLLVNLVGLFAFGHAGHDHSHGHSHGDHDHAHNENMHGIFLHVAADAGGSLAVIISTAVTIYHPWYLWDPLATIIIAILIFAAAVPLVVSSGQKLLLIIPEETEYTIKNFLQEVGEVRGVLAYAAPRFWMCEDGDEHSHKHDHGGCSSHPDENHQHDSLHQHTIDGSHHRHEHSHSSVEELHVHDTPHSHTHDSNSHDHDGTQKHSAEHFHGHPLSHHTAHSHDHTHDVKQSAVKLIGCLHVTAVPFADLDDIRSRVEELALVRGMQLTIHVEHAGEAQCWCGGNQKN